MRPALRVEMRQQLVPDARIRYRDFELAAAAGDRLNKIRSADDADQLAIPHDRDPFDAVLLQQSRDLVRGVSGVAVATFRVITSSTFRPCALM